VLTFVLAGDSNFAMQLAVALQSLTASHAEEECVAYLLHDGIETSLQAKIQQGLPRSGLEVKWVDARDDAVGSAQRPSFLPPASLFRLRVPSVLPAEIERAIYLDADLIVRKSLRPLWETGLGTDLCAAVQDPVVPWTGAPMGLPWRELGIDPSVPYFNAGVMVVPVARWRDANVERRALDLLGSRLLNYADQCALNAVIGGRWTKLDPKWNLQSGHLLYKSFGWVVEPTLSMDAALVDPAVVHYTNAKYRPWQWRCDHPFRDDWLRLLQRTAWAGWTPPTDYRRILVGTRARARGAWRRAMSR
jgi:lipopolysaccharide biosynthesis glycosyltransferase